MIAAHVVYWDGADAYTLSGSWYVMPTTGVLWVELTFGRFRHTLIGADRYWVSGMNYGTYHDNYNSGYNGPRARVWRVRRDGRGSVRVGSYPPPDGAHVLYGVLIPDEDWRRLAY